MILTEHDIIDLTGDEDNELPVSSSSSKRVVGLSFINSALSARNLLSQFQSPVVNERLLPHLEKRSVIGLGFGLFTNINIRENEFVMEYGGEHLSVSVGEQREAEYASSNCYMFFCTYGQDSFWYFFVSTCMLLLCPHFVCVFCTCLYV